MSVGLATGFPEWALIILIVFSVAWVGTAAFLVYRRREIYNYAINRARAGVVICVGDEAREELERSVFAGRSSVTVRNPMDPERPQSEPFSSTDGVGAELPPLPVGLISNSTTAVVVRVEPPRDASRTDLPVNLVPARPISFPSADPIASRYIGRINPCKILKREEQLRAADYAVLQRTNAVPPREVEGDGATSALDGDALYAAALLNPYRGNAIARGSLMESHSSSDDESLADARTDADTPATTASARARPPPNAYPCRHRCRHDLEHERINGELPTFHSCGEACVYFYIPHASSESAPVPIDDVGA